MKDLNEQPKESPRYTLHRLIGARERAEKRANFGNPKAQAELPDYEKAVDDFLKLHPELESEVETIEDHFFKLLYS